LPRRFTPRNDEFRHPALDSFVIPHLMRDPALLCFATMGLRVKPEDDESGQARGRQRFRHCEQSAAVSVGFGLPRRFTPHSLPHSTLSTHHTIGVVEQEKAAYSCDYRKIITFKQTFNSKPKKRYTFLSLYKEISNEGIN
jgi:hypothetical protein